MKSMNMPGFTAEDSFYTPSRHYQTSRHAIDSSRQMISAIHPAAAKMEEEVIVITEQWPPDPWIPWPPLSGGGGGGAPVTPFEGGDGGGAGDGAGGGTGRPGGPKLTTLKRLGFQCESMGFGIEELCHSCADTKTGRRCICYECFDALNECGEAFDCTSTYGKTG
jgi:hypothetical protein